MFDNVVYIKSIGFPDVPSDLTNTEEMVGASEMQCESCADYRKEIESLKAEIAVLREEKKELEDERGRNGDQSRAEVVELNVEKVICIVVLLCLKIFRFASCYCGQEYRIY